MASSDIGIDLGTASILVYVKGKGVVLKEPSVVAYDRDTEQIMAIGEEARLMLGRTPGNIVAVRPLRQGVISDYQVTEKMIKYFIQKALGKKTFRKPRISVCVPSGVTEVEKKAVEDATYQAGAREVAIIEEPIAAAIGAGIDISRPCGNMIVDIGADTTEISVISLGGLVLSDLLHFGGNRIDDSISSYIKKNFNLVIGRKTAKTLKEELGSGTPGMEKSMVIVGRDVVSGLPIEMEITAEVIYAAIKDNLNSICNSIKMILEKTPPELAKDIIHSGIYITGGGSKIHNLDKLFTEITNIKVNSCENPEECAVRGLNKIVSDEKYKHLGFSMKSKIYK